jgi:cytosine deaminase
MPEPTDDDHRFMKEALAEARLGLDEGGIPIGAVLVVDGRIVGRGHNRRLQQGNPILHGEMDCLQDAGRLGAAVYRRATMYTTLSPCDMCTGAILLYGIPRVVLAENRTLLGGEDLLRSRGVEVVNLDLDEAVELMQTFIDRQPEVWAEDIGEDA